MKFISNLSKEQQKQISTDLGANLIVNVKMICSIADKYDVDRNELFDLWLHNVKDYFDKHDLNEQKDIPKADVDKKKVKSILKYLIKLYN